MRRRDVGTTRAARTSDQQEDTDRDTDDGPVALQPEDKEKKYRSLKTRTYSTVAILLGFFAVLYGGHVPMMLLILTLQALIVREAFKICSVPQQDRKLRGFRAQQWYFFWVAVFFIYFRFIQNNLLVELAATRLSSRLFLWFLKRHTILSFSLYMGGFVAFVLSLKRGLYSYQFGQYAWTHMVIFLVVLPSSFFVASIFQGLFWFMLPCLLIVVNDIFAYLAGFCFGRTPLIKLSPKKTWEGFIGGFICTVIFAYYTSRGIAHFDWFRCPRKDLSFGWLHCARSEVFQDRDFTPRDLVEIVPEPLVEVATTLVGQLPPSLQQTLSTHPRLRAMPVQLHAMVLAVFASVIAPFGGFYASGFKRAFKMKDFGDTIPGHGGITDRFDCQILMACFSAIYYWTYAYSAELSVVDALETVLRLDGRQQVQLLATLANLLVGENLLPAGPVDQLLLALPPEALETS